MFVSNFARSFSALFLASVIYRSSSSKSSLDLAAVDGAVSSFVIFSSSTFNVESFSWICCIACSSSVLYFLASAARSSDIFLMDWYSALSMLPFFWTSSRIWYCASSSRRPNLSAWFKSILFLFNKSLNSGISFSAVVYFLAWRSEMFNCLAISALIFLISPVSFLAS